MSSIVPTRLGATSPWGVADASGTADTSLMVGWEAPIRSTTEASSHSAMDWQPVVGVALQRIRTRSRVDGWDGEGSFAVTAGTIAIAEQVIAALERLLPVGIDAPDVFAEADGDIGIEWDIARRLTYWISVNGNGRISFAGLFGSQGADHGWRPLDLSSPRALDRSLDVVVVHVLRLFPSTVGTRAA